MPFYDPWRRPPPPPPRPKPERAVLPALVAEFEDMPLGGFHGETLPTPPPAATTVQTGLEIPPPDWEQDQVSISIDTSVPPTAFEVMMANAAELGEVDELPPLGPVLHEYTPPLPVPIPEVDWRNP